MCTRPFDKKNICSSFIYSSFCARPFDQKLGLSMIYIFYLHATIRREYMVLFHVIFLVCSTIEPKIRDITDLFLLDTYDHSTYSTIHIHACVSIILSLSTTIRPKMRVLIIFFYLYTTIRPKLGVTLTI